MRRASKLAAGAAVAAVVGYVAGILTAPKSGKETRKDIERAASTAKKEAEKRLKQLHTDLSEVIELGKKQAATAQKSAAEEIAKLVNYAAAAKEKVREALSNIHEGETDGRDLEKTIAEVDKTLAELKTYLQTHGSPKN